MITQLPDAPEKSILQACLHYLLLKGFLCKRNNAGRVPITHVSTGTQRWINVGEKGWPDIELIDHRYGGRYVGIEIKTRTGKVSPGQVERGAQIVKAGGLYIVARSVEDLEKEGF